MADTKLLHLADDLEGFGRRPLETPTDMGWRERILVRLALAEILRRLAGVPPVSQAPHPLDALLPEICQLIDGCKADWERQGCWSAWDQSVRDRITAYNLSRAGSAVPSGVQNTDGGQ